MCPEKNITVEQAKKLYSWIKEEKKGEVVVLVPDDEPVDFLKSKINANNIFGFSVVGGEPLVVFANKEVKDERKLFCSEKHAQELEKKGIVKFSEPKQK